MKTIEEIKNDVYLFPQNDAFFKNNTFDDACFKLTCAIEKIHLALLSPELIIQSDISTLQDICRGAYREALKDAYRFCSNPTNVEDSQINDGSDAYEQIVRCQTFNQIRNSFEQYKLNRLAINLIDETTIKFTRNESKRNINADLYARWSDAEKFELEQRTIKSKNAHELMSYLVDPTIETKWDPQKQEPKIKSFFQRIVQLAYDKIIIDGEEQGLIDYDFGKFSLEAFRKIYAILIALGVLNYNYHYVSILLRRRFEYNKNTPIIYKAKNDLINIIEQYSNIERKKIESVINILIYDPNYHKDKITIYQPLFLKGNDVFYSPMIVYFSLAQDKLLYLIKEKGEHEQLISRLAKNREEIMTDEVIEYISESDLLYNANYKIIQNGVPVAEFDLPVFDEKSNILLLIELKWFFKGDGEFDHNKIDCKIKNAIQSRIEKQTILKNNYKEILKDMLDVDCETMPEIMSCIVSKNYSGSSFIEDTIPVFDEFLFRNTLKKVNFNLSEFVSVVKSDDYLPKTNELGIGYAEQKLEYAGYSFIIPSISNKE